MGNYLSYDKITLRIPAAELLQLLNVAGDADATTVETVAADIITDVEGWMDSYVSKRRQTPVESELRALGGIAFRAFLWQVHLDRRSVTEDQQKAHEADEKWLLEYSEGKLSLGDAKDPTTPGGSQEGADGRQFTREKMRGW